MTTDLLMLLKDKRRNGALTQLRTQQQAAAQVLRTV